jgi:hypothetical protein
MIITKKNQVIIGYQVILILLVLMLELTPFES